MIAPGLSYPGYYAMLPDCSRARRMVLSNVRARITTASAGGNFAKSLSRSSLDNGSASFAVRFGALRLGVLRAVSSGMCLLTVLCAAIEPAAALSVVHLD